MVTFGICVPTYKRPDLLRRLIADLFHQSYHPDHLIVVDGDPGSKEVIEMLLGENFPNSWQVTYIPSNHANLPYQRYLAWKVAKLNGCDIILYLDDDLTISQPDAVRKTVAPLLSEDNIVGVTAQILMSEPSNLLQGSALRDIASAHNKKNPLLVRRLGAARNIPPGALSPSGHRKAAVYCGKDYEPVQWLRGGVMAYRMATLTKECFSEKLFSSYYKGYGKGEDTLLSRRVGTKGQLLMAFGAHFQHPHDDLPQAYPTQAFKFGQATAYSRRLLNDNYRGFDPPQFSDRVALVKSYLGTSCLNWWRALTAPKKHRFAYAWGYTLGAFRGLIQKPTAQNLTPHLNWWQDADEALRHTSTIHEGRDG